MRCRIGIPLEVGVRDRLQIQSHLHGAAHPDVIERWILYVIEIECVVGPTLELPELDVGIGLLQALHLVDRPHLRVASSPQHIKLAARRAAIRAAASGMIRATSPSM